jgi:uncharacterized membrane protein
MAAEKKQQSGKRSERRKGSGPLNTIVHKNIQAILEYQQRAARKRGLQERVADAITAFSGNMLFVVLHVVWFGLWLAINSGWFGLPPFDPFPYGLLTMIVSLEAIFLSTFVLISQNRMSQQDRQRAELDLQINLLTEHELTRVLNMLDTIETHLGIEGDRDKELRELEEETKPGDVLKEIEEEEFGRKVE